MMRKIDKKELLHSHVMIGNKDKECPSCQSSNTRKVTPVCVGAQYQEKDTLQYVFRWLCQCQECKTIFVRDS